MFKIKNMFKKKDFKKGAFSKGQWLHITGNDLGGFHVNQIANGRITNVSKSMLYEDAIFFATNLQEWLKLNEDCIMVKIQDLLDSVDNSEVVNEAKEAALLILEEEDEY